MNNKLTVLILTAGYGRRMGQFSDVINKSLIPYQNRPLISHIIDQFPSSTEFVIACGYLEQQVKTYISQVHYDKSITLVSVPNYDEKNTGPATSILACKEYLPESFIWITCDTLFSFDYQNKLEHNWIAVYPVDQNISQDYCWIRRNGNQVKSVHNKVIANSAVDAFIGLMYVHSKQFIENLEIYNAKEVYQGFSSNLELQAHTVYNWLDFGTYEKWSKNINNTAILSLAKPNEIFYHDNNLVIKYFSDINHPYQRVQRAKTNSAVMPNNVRSAGNFLIHDWVPGSSVYEYLTPDLFYKMLNWCEHTLWKNPILKNLNIYQQAAQNFYYTKTFERIKQLYFKHNNWSECLKINDRPVNTISYYLENLNWSVLIDNVRWKFIHGDLHFDNVITDGKKFTCIDWRSDFAGDIYGDIYYDLAKLLGGIRLNYLLVRQNKFNYTEIDGSVTISVPTVESVDTYEQILKDWVISQNLNWYKVELLVPLIYINMSPLHEEYFSKFLVALAQMYFSRVVA